MSAYRSNIVSLFPDIELESFLKCPSCQQEIDTSNLLTVSPDGVSWGRFDKTRKAPTFAGTLVHPIITTLGPQRPRFCRGRTWLVRVLLWLSPVRSVEPPCPKGSHLHVSCSFCAYRWTVSPEAK